MIILKHVFFQLCISTLPNNFILLVFLLLCHATSQSGSQEKVKATAIDDELNKGKNREKDKLVRESVWINMSQEEKELQRIKSRLRKEMNIKRQRQTESANGVEMQKENNRDSTIRSWQTESAKKAEMQKQNNIDSTMR